MAVTWRDRCGVAVGQNDRPCRCVCPAWSSCGLLAGLSCWVVRRRARIRSEASFQVRWPSSWMSPGAGTLRAPGFRAAGRRGCAMPAPGRGRRHRAKGRRMFAGQRPGSRPGGHARDDGHARDNAVRAASSLMRCPRCENGWAPGCTCSAGPWFAGCPGGGRSGCSGRSQTSYGGGRGRASGSWRRTWRGWLARMHP